MIKMAPYGTHNVLVISELMNFTVDVFHSDFLYCLLMLSMVLLDIEIFRGLILIEDILFT